ncbi:MAG: proton-conducting transporter membrane subunit [Anaerolineae bacterium]
MIAGLLLFLVLPLVVGSAVYVLRRWRLASALVSVGMALALGLGIVLLPLGQTVEIWGRQIVMGGRLSFLGRELILEEKDRVAIAFLYLTTSGLFLLGWRVSPRNLLFPVGFGVLSLLSGSLLIRPLIYAVLLVEIAIAISVFALRAEGGRTGRGALQYLSFSLLAMPGLLVIHWLMDRYRLTPDNTALLDTAAVLLSLSFALLLGSVPFHTWIPALGDDSEPLASAFVLTVNYGAIWFLLLGYLETYPDLTGYARFASITSGAGVAMVSVGGLLAACQNRFGRLMGYGALMDSGVSLIALGMSSDRGLALVVLSLLVRPFGLGLMAVGLRGFRARRGHDLRSASVRGLGRRAAWSTFAFVTGGLSAAGLPISAGFAGRWSLYRALGTSRLAPALTVMAASVGLMVGVWRALHALLAADELLVETETEAEEGAERWPSGIAVLLAVVASAVVGLAPQLLAPTAARVAGMYTFLAP